MKWRLASPLVWALWMCAFAPARAAPASRSHHGAAVSGCPGRAPSGVDAEGCTLLAAINIGPVSGQAYWHIDRFPDEASAEAARTLYGVSTLASGVVLLQTISENPGWRPERGERLATIGPLRVRTDQDMAARLIEARLVDGARAIQMEGGVAAILVLDGRLCVQTAGGSLITETDEFLILPVGATLRFASLGGVPARTLLLDLFPVGGAWTETSITQGPVSGCS